MGPTLRIALSLVLLTMSLLVAGNMFGLVPSRVDLEMENRKIQAETLAIQLSTDADKRDLRHLDTILGALVERHPKILSAAMRRPDASFLATGGDHETHWKKPSKENSSVDHVQVPIFSGAERWATLEISYSPLLPTGLGMVSSSAIFPLGLFVGVGGFLAYFLFMHRTLKILNPSTVIPQRVQAALDVLAEGVLILDEDECVVLANSTFAAHVGCEPEQLIGRNAADFRWSRLGDHDAGHAWPWSTGDKTGKDTTGVALILTTPSGACKTFTVNASAIMDGKGKRRGTLVTFDDVTRLESTNNELKTALDELQQSQAEIHRQNSELRMLATRDSLTGALNRRAFFQLFKSAFDEAVEAGTPLSCIMLDIDHFKSINDNYGHAAGDRVIKSLADIVTELVRTDDMVARYGGEEFAVVLPGLTADAAAQIGERIRVAIESQLGAAVGGDVKVTSSLGVASVDSNAESAEAMLDLADQALYVAKESGRNQLVQWREGLSKDDAIEAAQQSASDGTAPNVTETISVTRETDLVRLKARFRELQKSLDNDKPGSGAPPNHTAFMQQVNQAIDQAKNTASLVAMLVIDLRMFHHLGDNMTQVFGDHLVASASERLQTVLRGTDTVGALAEGDNVTHLFRMSAEEFGVLLSDLDDVESVTQIVKRLLDVLAEPLNVDGDEIFVTSTVGISLYPNDGHDAGVLLRNARTARTHARRQGRYYHFQFYAEQMNAASTRVIRLETLLPRALERGELSLHYQPKVDLASGRITGVEALLRWRNAELGDIPPDQFIKIAEHTGLILPIGDWVLRTAIAQAAAWRTAGIKNANMAINLSAAQLRDGRLAPRITSLLKEYGLEPDCIEFELTETLIMEDTPATVASMQALHALGARIAIDDFGTGHSSLGYLKTFPIDTVKIDRSFMLDVATSETDRTLVTGIVSMSQGLGLRVIAEGVETAEQLQFLRKIGCDELQGYLFSTPLPAAEVETLLRNGIDVTGAKMATG
jgi:diguanylate cyclase (GGDEF)-like protein/PAS domain S-box-containing protein